MSTGKGDKVSRRTFLKGATAIGTAALAAGSGAKTVFNHIHRDLRPGRAAAYLESVPPLTGPGPEQPQAGVSGHSVVSADLPNLVLILVDDLGYGDLALGGAGPGIIRTPNLERMATEGVQFTSFYSSAALCTPSRAGMLTGRYPVRTHMTSPLYPTGHPMNIVMHLVGRYAYGVTDIPEDEVLLSEVLQRRGYHTGMVGKWHLGDKPGHIPNDRGFDSYYGALHSNDESPYHIYRDREIELRHPVDQDQLTGNFTREAEAFIRQSREGPFFLYLAHAMPHEPIHASSSFRETSAAGLYGDAVQELDWSVGRILDTLEELGLDRNTLVIFTSDNGPWWQGNPGHQRGRKMLAFEGGFRVPFLARWPGVIPAGAVSDAMSMNFDLFPTLLGLAGVPLPADRIIDGRDILSLLVDGAPSPHECLFFYYTRTAVAAREGAWKYYRRYQTDNAGYWPLKQGPFLFRLDTDPNESYSLIESEPERAAHLAAQLDAWDDEVAANLRGWLAS